MLDVMNHLCRFTSYVAEATEMLHYFQPDIRLLGPRLGARITEIACSLYLALR